MLTLLQKTRLIDNEYRLPTVQFFHSITAYPVARLFCIPARSVQKMLDRIRRRFPHLLGQLPAVLALTAAQQALQIRKAPRTGFRTRKQLRDQPMRPQQLALPSRQTFLHHPCRRITPQSGFRVAYLSTTVVLSRRPVAPSGTCPGLDPAKEKNKCAGLPRGVYSVGR